MPSGLSLARETLHDRQSCMEDSRKDYAHFLVISRGSATETRGRYEQRLRHWLPEDTIKARVALCEEIIAILSASIRTLRTPN